MPRLISTLPNHSGLVNGIRFAADRGQMLSEEVPDEVAATMATIPGYSIVARRKAVPLPPADPPAADAPPPPVPSTESGAVTPVPAEPPPA